MVFRGVDTTTAIDVTTQTATGVGTEYTNHIYVDPPSITPATAGAMLVIIGAGSENDTSEPTPPSGYSDQEYIYATPGYDYSLVAATKTWSSGTEDPGSWDLSIAYTQERAWAAVTLALRPDPAVVVEPDAATLTIAGEQAGYGFEFVPAAAELTLAGSAVEMTMVTATLSVPLPPLSVLIERIGPGGDLVVDLTPLSFYGTTNIPGSLITTLPEITFESLAGGKLDLEFPALESAFSGASGIISSFDVDLPVLAFSAQAAGQLNSVLSVPEALFSADVTQVGHLITRLPAFAALFSGYQESDAAAYQSSLVVNLPSIRSLFESHTDLYASLNIDLHPLSTLFTAYTGDLASLQVELPALEALLSAYSDVTGEIVTILPALQMLFEASASGRFDTDTLSQLDITILKWVRPQ